MAILLVDSTRRLEPIAAVLLLRNDRTVSDDCLSVALDRNLELPLARSLSGGKHPSVTFASLAFACSYAMRLASYSRRSSIICTRITMHGTSSSPNGRIYSSSRITKKPTAPCTIRTSVISSLMIYLVSSRRLQWKLMLIPIESL